MKIFIKAWMIARKPQPGRDTSPIHTFPCYVAVSHTSKLIARRLALYALLYVHDENCRRYFMANARFHGWGKRARSRRSALLLSIPLVCVLLLGTIVTYHLLPSGSTSRASNGTVQIPGHVPGLVKSSALLGQADAAKQIQLLVGFKPRDAQALKNYVDSMALPQSANAHRYLTPAQVATAFAPAQSVQDALVAYMQQAGFSVSSTYKQHLMIGFKGTIGDAEQAFNIQINNYRAPDGQVFYAPSSDPSVPDSFGS